MRRNDSTQWYREAFDEYYVDLYNHRDCAEAERFIELLGKHVGLGNALTLDLACGAGRHLGALERAGALAVGLDLSRALLRKAAAGGFGLLVRADMRILPFHDEVLDGAISMFTSFGYFEDLEDEMSVLAEVARCLKPEGWFVIDYMNSIVVKRSLERESRRQVGHLQVVERRSIDLDERRVIKEVQLTDRGHLVKGYTEMVKLLGADELRAMLAEAGLEPELLWGDYSGGEFKEDESQRLIVFCEKR